MADPVVDYRPIDRMIWEEELAEFVPFRVFDAHAHLWTDLHLPCHHPARGRIPRTDLSLHREWSGCLYPGRSVHFLMLGCPGSVDMDVRAHNSFLAREMGQDPCSRAGMLVTPAMSPAEVERAIDEHGFVGIKPYRFFSVTGDSVECAITDFLPEGLIEVAHQKRLFVILHLSRRQGCADERNIRELDRLTQRYPNVRWILAHCARSFASWMISRAVDRLRDMPQIWYDLSAVNDMMTFYVLFKKEDRQRLLFGSDNVWAGCARSKYITFARAWAYLSEGAFSRMDLSHCNGEPTLVVYEQLRAMAQAAEAAELTRRDVEDIFHDNASRLFQPYP